MTTAHEVVVWADADPQVSPGHWRFVLRSHDGPTLLHVEDTEPDVRGERLELLAVVRALEALESPSRVTMITPSRYVRRGLTYGLESWRRSQWVWEAYGRMVPIKNADLWQRVDRAAHIHQIRCVALRGGQRAMPLEDSQKAETSAPRRQARLRERLTAAYERAKQPSCAWQLSFA